MTTPDVERVVLDTNVLLAASDSGRLEHERAVATLNDWATAGIVLYTSGQILREYLAVATRPIAVNGLGMSSSDAVANVNALRARLQPLSEDVKVLSRLLVVLGQVRCRGKQVHDANIVATMLVHGVGSLVTSNTSDFARFHPLIEVVALS